MPAIEPLAVARPLRLDVVTEGEHRLHERAPVASAARGVRACGNYGVPDQQDRA